MDAVSLRRMFDYHYWATHLVWDCVMTLTEEQFAQDVGYSHGSIKRLMIHTLGTEIFWFTNVTSAEPFRPPASFDPDSPQVTREFIRAMWDDSEAKIRAYLDTVTDEELNRVMHYEFPWCGPQSHPVWEALMYIVTHAIDHRATILQDIHNFGGETVMQDYLRYVWEQNPHESA